MASFWTKDVPQTSPVRNPTLLNRTKHYELQYSFQIMLRGHAGAQLERLQHHDGDGQFDDDWGEQRRRRR